MKKIVLLLLVICSVSFAVSRAPSFLSDTNSFSVVVIPDMHLEIAQNSINAKAQMNWIVANQSAWKIKNVVGVGDIVTHAKTRAEWLRADTAFSILDAANIPYIVAAGNHDYDTLTAARPLDSFNLYFPKTRFTSKSWWNGAFADSSKSSESGYNVITVGAYKYLFATMELLPRNSITAWAKNLFDTSTAHFKIATTHSYLDSNDTRTIASGGFTDYDNGDSIWNKLKYTTVNQIFCGDVGGYLGKSGYQSFYTRNGTLCNAHLQDYQMEAASNGGNGYLRIYTYYPDSNRIEVRTFSPITKKYSTTEYRDNFSCYMRTPTKIKNINNSRIKLAYLPNAAKTGYSPDSIFGNFAINNIATKKSFVYVGPQNDTDYSPTGANLAYGNGKFYFNGTNTSISNNRLAQRLNTSHTNDMTVMAWLARDTASGRRQIFGQNISVASGLLDFEFTASPNRLRTITSSGTSRQSTSVDLSGVISNNQIVHVGFRINGGHPDLYYNGDSVTATTADVTGDTLCKPLLVGYAGTAFWKEPIYSLVLFDTAMVESDFADQYSAGSALGGIKLFRNNFLTDSNRMKIREFYDSLVITSAYTQSDSVFTNWLFVDTAATLAFPLDIDNDANINANLTANAVINVDGDITVTSGNVTFDSAVSCVDLTFNNSGDAVTINDTITVSGTFSCAQGVVFVYGVNGAIVLSSCSPTLNGNSTVGAGLVYPEGCGGVVVRPRRTAFRFGYGFGVGFR